MMAPRTRRAALRAAVSAAALLAGWQIRTTAAQTAPDSGQGAAFMARARALRDAAVAAGDQAYGAVLVRDGRIVGDGPSRVVQDNDPTAHAEMTAIRDAARRMATRDLSGTVLYATSAPCAMCETAAYFAGVSRIVVGESLDDRGAPRHGGR